MKLARLHRRLASAMALAALGAFAAGDGVGPLTLAAAAALLLSFFWLPRAHAGIWVERATRTGIIALFGWLVYAAFVLGQDFMPGVIAMLLFLLAGEVLRPLEARNDMRLYSLSFALLIAATAFYPGLGFAAGFVAYVGLTVLAMMVGYLRREAERFRAGGVRVGRGFLWTTVALSGVTLAMSACVFLLFPRLPRAWNVQGRRGAGGEMVGFSNRVSLGEFGGRIASNPEVMFRVEFPDGPPADASGIHWRGRSFDHFDGQEWARSNAAGFAQDLDTRDYAMRWGGPFRRMRIFGGPPGADVLFGPQPVLMVQPRSSIRIFRGGTGDLFFLGSDNPVYSVITAGGVPSDDRLRTAAGADERTLWIYEQLPALDPRVRRLADSLTAGHAARIDQVRAVERWLSTQLRYTLDLPATRADATIEGFLFRRRAGHCEYFSTAMAVLLRARGIPARNVNGFLGGEWNENGQYLAVTGNNAHSWVEVWFPGWGWVPFDPTPPSREAVLDGTGGGWIWGARLWFDGIEYRWYKWVVDYNVERQLSVFRGISSFFQQGERARGSRGGGWGAVRLAETWLLVPVALALLWMLARRRAPGARPPRRESRTYLGLRRAYARAGWRNEDDGGPLEFAEALARDHAPGADDAGRAVDLYLRARFSGQPGDADARRELAEHAARARSAVRRAGKRRKPVGV